MNLTQQQLQQKIQELKAQGLDDNYINTRLQKEISSGNIQIAPEAKSVGGFVGNVGRDIGENIAGLAALPGLAIKSITQPSTLPETGKQLATGLYNEYKDLITNPVDTAYNKPISSILDVLPFLAAGKASLAGKAGKAGELAKLAEAGKIAETGAGLGKTGELSKILGTAEDTGKYAKMTIPEQMFQSNFTIPRAMEKWLKPRDTVKSMLEYKNVGSMEDIGNFANNIAGDSGFITKLQRKAIGLSGDNIQTGNILDGINKQLDSVIDITPAQQQRVMANIQKTIPKGEKIGSANALDVFDSITELEKTGYQYLKKGTNSFTGNIRDEEIGRIYLNAAENLKSSLETGVKNQGAIRNVITPEIIAEATKLSPKLGAELSKVKTIRDLRSIQAPFVRIQKMIDATLGSENSVFGKVGKGMQAGKLPIVGGAIELASAPFGGSTGITTRAAGGIQNAKLGEILNSVKTNTGNVARGAYNTVTNPSTMAKASIVGRQGQAPQGQGELDNILAQAPQETAQPSPIDEVFGGRTKQEVLAMAVQSGLPLKNLKEIGDLYDQLSTSDSGVGNVGKVSAQNYSNASTGQQSLNEVQNLLFNPDGSLNKATIIALKTPGRPSETARLAAAHLYNVADAYLRLRTGATANPAEIQKLANNLEPGVTDNAKVIKEKLKIYQNVFDEITKLSGTQGIGEDITTLQNAGIQLQ